jgi:predicted metal-dependent hydrolase
MKKKIDINHRQVEYTLRRSKRARRMRLTVYCDGNFVVTVPRGMNEGLIERFISAKSRWIIDKLEYFKKFPGLARPKSSKKEFLERKGEAMHIVKARIEHFNALYGFAFNAIHIRNQKTRWGSCSRRGNLSFNYKIVLLPPHLRDLVIVHELCHLEEFNHSRDFWHLVARAIPDYRKARRELKQNRIL